jgi:hypothetical protein
MKKLKTYNDLFVAATRAIQSQKERELELLAALEAIDRDLVADGLDLMAGSREALAHYLMQPIPALGRTNCYEMLATGNRERVVQLINAVRHGVYL